MCVWREPMEYADQLDALLLLQRIVEHFAASTFGLDHTPSMDSVRMTVPACIAAVTDVIMRSEATDIPSEACLHLRKYALSSAALARQAATVPACTPELSLAREGALDYFASLDRLPKIFEWQRTGSGWTPRVHACLRVCTCMHACMHAQTRTCMHLTSFHTYRAARHLHGSLPNSHLHGSGVSDRYHATVQLHDRPKRAHHEELPRVPLLPRCMLLPQDVPQS